MLDYLAFRIEAKNVEVTVVENYNYSAHDYLKGGLMGTIGGDNIKDIEKIRGSKVIIYFTGDRPFELTHAMITVEDAVRYLYDHLLSLKFGESKNKIIDLFLYSRGGDVSVPWRIVSMD